MGSEATLKGEDPCGAWTGRKKTRETDASCCSDQMMERCHEKRIKKRSQVMLGAIQREECESKEKF